MIFTLPLISDSKKGCNMGNFVELVLELLFVHAKNVPEEMPEIEYRDSFIIRYPRKKTAAKICATLILIGVFTLLWIFIKHETRFLFAAFVGLGIILLILSMYSLSFECRVNDTEIVRSSFWIFKKKVLWHNVSCVRVLETTNEKTVTIALYDQNGRWMIEFTTDMENAWHAVKVAERKEIKIQKERDVPISKQGRL